MNTESVVEFLGNVALLRRLTSSSLKRVAEVAVFKRYERGDYVVREDENVDAVYFLLEGEARVLGPAGEENCLLKRFDFFGRGIFGDTYSADVVAVSELTCLLLMSEHCPLLDTKSDKTLCLVERILYMDPLDLNVFRGITLPNAPTYGKVFGGQLVGQALAAASKTVDSTKIVHNLHSYFLRVGDINIPIIYDVNRLRDGNNFATRRVDAREKGKTIFTLFASFQRELQGFTHQESTMPHVPAPETLIPREEMLERRKTDPLLPRDYRNKVASEDVASEHVNPWPVDIRFCEPNYSTEYTKSPPSLNPHRREGMSAAVLSLDHSIWFHRPVKADDWLLFVMVSPTGSESRGFTTGEMFNRKGELVVSLTQEALLKKAVTIKPIFGAKL